MKSDSAVNPPDVSTLDGVVKALYESFTFKPGNQPDYDRLRSLFHPDARVTPPSLERAARAEVLDIESFITKSSQFIVISGLERKGFVEREIARRVEAYGRVAQVFSTYESRYTPADPEPFQRGINSIQLVKDGNRWWVVSIIWDIERPTTPIPKAFMA